MKLTIKKDHNNRIIIISYGPELPMYDDRIWAHCGDVGLPITVEVLHGVPENEN